MGSYMDSVFRAELSSHTVLICLTNSTTQFAEASFFLLTAT